MLPWSKGQIQGNDVLQRPGKEEDGNKQGTSFHESLLLKI